MIKNPHNALFADGDIIFFDGDSVNVTFSSDKIDILSVDLNNINLDDTSIDEDGPETIIYVRLIAWGNRLKRRKAFNKYISKGLMTGACQKMRKREWNQFLLIKLVQNKICLEVVKMILARVDSI